MKYCDILTIVTKARDSERVRPLEEKQSQTQEQFSSRTETK